MTKLALLVIALCLSGTAAAELYKWVDKNGKVHFSDKDPGLNNQDAPPVELIQPEEGNTYSADEAMSPEMKKTMEKMTDTRESIEDERRKKADEEAEEIRKKEYQENAERQRMENEARERRKERERRKRLND